MGEHDKKVQKLELFRQQCRDTSFKFYDVVNNQHAAAILGQCLDTQFKAGSICRLLLTLALNHHDSDETLLEANVMVKQSFPHLDLGDGDIKKPIRLQVQE